MDRLASDEVKVAQIGVTHQHLAQQLEKVLVQSVNERRKFGVGPDPKISIDFCYQPHVGEIATFKTQVLSITHRSFAGAQWSFFKNLEHEEETEEDRISWKEDHEIWNEAFPSVVLKVAGGIGSGIVHYIGKYGFYEGGESNPYRVDPSVLHWVLTGISTKSALTYMQTFYEACISDINARMELDLRQLNSGTPPLEENSLREIEMHIREASESEKQEWLDKLQHLRLQLP